MLNNTNEFNIPVNDLPIPAETKADSRIRQYRKFVSEKTDTEYVSKANIRAFFHFMSSEGWEKPCGNNYLRNIRTILKNSLYLWYEQNGLSDYFHIHWADFFHRLKIKKPRKTINPLNIPTRERLNEIISKTSSPLHQLIIATAYHTGMRPIEIANLKVSDVSRKTYDEFASGTPFYTVSVFSKKTQSQRMVPVSKNLIDDIYKILKPTEYLFVTPQGKQFDYARIYRIIRNASTDDRGLWLNPYKLREAHATHMHELVGDIHLNASTLGHSPDINMKVYVQPMSILKGSHKIVQAFRYEEIRESIVGAV